MGTKWDTTNYVAEVCVSETGMLRGATATGNFSLNNLVIAVPKMGQMS